MRRTLGGWLSLILLSLGLNAPAADPLDTWHWRRPTTTGNQLYGAAYGSGRYVVVGDVGTILVSEEGRAWRTVSSGTRRNLSAVSFGGGQFVAVGQVGELLVSSDGVAWASAQSGVATNLNSALFADGRWVAVGDGGTITTSTNGTNWVVTKSGGLRLADLSWDNGRFLAVGGRYQQLVEEFVALVSTNGMDWQNVTIPINN